MSEVRDGSDLTPKKFHMNGYARYGDRLQFCVNVYQELQTADTAKAIFDIVVEYFKLPNVASDHEALFEAWRNNSKLLHIKVPGLEMSSNGTRYPSCTIIFDVENPYWDYDLPWDQQQKEWFLGFTYKKGKWALRNHVYGHGNIKSVPEQVRLSELIVASRDEL